MWYNHQQCLPRGRALGPCWAVAWVGRAAGRRGPLDPHRCSPRWGRTAPHQNHQGTPQSTTLGPAAISYTITLLFCPSALLIGPSLCVIIFFLPLILLSLLLACVSIHTSVTTTVVVLGDRGELRHWSKGGGVGGETCSNLLSQAITFLTISLLHPLHTHAHTHIHTHTHTQNTHTHARTHMRVRAHTHTHTEFLF